jgi:hypothetical protein
MSAKLTWFKDRKAKEEEGLLRVPAVIGSIDPHEEDSFERIVRAPCLIIEARDMPLHDFTASALP